MIPNESSRPSTLIFDYIDKLSVVGSNREQGISSAPVWQFGIKGDFDETVAFKALEGLVRIYPILASHLVPRKKNRSIAQSRHLAYQLDPEPDLSRLFRSVDLSDASEAAFEDFRQQLFDHFIDMSCDYPVSFTWVRRGPDEGIFFLQQHHAIADGKAFFALIRDFCSLYDRVLQGDSLADLNAVEKMPEDQVAVPQPARRILYRLSGYLFNLRLSLAGFLFPPDALACNQSRDFTGHNKVIHALVDDDILQRLKEIKIRSGYSVNDLLSAAMALSMTRWTEEKGFPVRRMNLLIPADVRPRDWNRFSFANHLSSFYILLGRKEFEAPLVALRTAAGQIRRQLRQRMHIKKLLGERSLSRFFSIGLLQKLIFHSKKTLLNSSFSNLISISPKEDGNRFITRSWQGESLRIMTPCGFLVSVNTTVIRYAGQLCFNFNYKESAVDGASVERLIELFHDTLEELMTGASGG